MVSRALLRMSLACFPRADPCFGRFCVPYSDNSEQPPVPHVAGEILLTFSHSARTAMLSTVYGGEVIVTTIYGNWKQTEGTEAKHFPQDPAAAQSKDLNSGLSDSTQSFSTLPCSFLQKQKLSYNDNNKNNIKTACFNTNSFYFQL